MWELLHPAGPVVGIPPQGHDQGVLDVLARRAPLALLPARTVPVLNTLVDAILEPVLGGKKGNRVPQQSVT